MPILVYTITFRVPPMHLLASRKLNVLVCDGVLAPLAPVRKVLQKMILAVKIILVVETCIDAAFFFADLAAKMFLVIELAKRIVIDPSQGF